MLLFLVHYYTTPGPLEIMESPLFEDAHSFVLCFFNETNKHAFKKYTEIAVIF